MGNRDFVTDHVSMERPSSNRKRKSMMAYRFLDRDLEHKVNDVLQNIEPYHNEYYEYETSRGPSLYFHRRALGLAGEITDDQKIELVYAVLTSWGMHRMGKNGPKMQPFEIFKNSISSVEDDIKSLTNTCPSKLSSSDWSALERIFNGIKVMASAPKLVGNSKVISHVLPNLVAPVDRQYTLKFLFERSNFNNRLELEWRLLRKIHSEFYYPVMKDKNFLDKAEAWVAEDTQYVWDTSILKVIDNLVIGAVIRAKKKA